MEANQELNVMDVAARCRSKREVYNVLTTTGCLYPPPIEYTNKNFMRGILSGSKLYVKWSDVKVIKVPHIKGLEVANIIKFAKNNTDIQKYLPEYDYKKEPNRDWIWNIVHTLIQDKFNTFISEKINEREKTIINSRNLGVSVLPEIINIIKKSKSVSTSKGRSHFLFRSMTLKKTNNADSMEEEKFRHEDEYIKQLEQNLDSLKAQVEMHEQREDEALENREKLAKLYELGVIDSDGEYKK